MNAANSKTQTQKTKKTKKTNPTEKQKHPIKTENSNKKLQLKTAATTATEAKERM